jgi:peptidoglycan/LPS O-acetylase OafA/YrhL
VIELIRYALALTVADAHLWPIGFSGASWQAVFAFYALSGYLITRVLHQRYGFAPAGTAAFLVNRVMRLWPAYLVVVAGTALALHFLPLQNFFFSLTAPHTLLEKITLVTILGQVGFDFLYLIPLSRLAATSWSLSIEIFCYCLLGLYFAKTPARLLALAALGLVGISLSTGYCWLIPSPYYGPYCFQNRYGVLQAGFIPFAAGGLVYFYRPQLRRWLAAYWKWLAAALLAAEAIVAASLFASATIGPYLGVVGMVAVLAWHGAERRPSRAVDFIGRASYHLFIAHMSIAAILVVGLAVPANTFTAFALTTILALALSGVLVPLEWRLNRMRGRISGWGRQRAPATVATAPVAVAAAAAPPGQSN